MLGNYAVSQNILIFGRKVCWKLIMSYKSIRCHFNLAIRKQLYFFSFYLNNKNQLIKKYLVEK